MPWTAVGIAVVAAAALEFSWRLVDVAASRAGTYAGQRTST